MSYGCINMAVNVQAARLLYRMLHKQNVSFGFSQCIAVAHGNGKKWQKKPTDTKKYTCTIYKRIRINDETAIRHTPLLFSLPPPVRR